MSPLNDDVDVEPLLLGLVGPALHADAAPAVCATWASFQRHFGELEAAPVGGYRCGHAAVNAFVNGVERVAFAPAASPEATVSAAAALARRCAPAVLVLPELIASRELIASHALITTLRALRGAFEEPPRIVVDGPPEASVAELCALAGELGEADGGVRLLAPWCVGVSPGRRADERLPATAVAAGLLFGAPRLRGVCAALRTWREDERERLLAAGVLLLAERGPRRQLALAGGWQPLRTRPRELDAPAALDAPVAVDDPGLAALQAQLVQELQAELRGQPNGPRLWKTLERRTRALLEASPERVRFTQLLVRCNAETSADGNPVVEVYVREPKRVRSLRLVMNTRV